MSGILYLCATPIGNLGDMTNRCIETLREADLIAAEDTRNTVKLLNHFGIETPMTAYHEHNKYEKADKLVEKLLSGENIALVTDAGTPGISDPGEVLVKKCREQGIGVTSLPGCCALISALILSGLPTRRFCFEAFLPADKKERTAILEELSGETRTILLYEAPHHLTGTLRELSEALGDRKIVLCRELTKKFEEVREFSTIKEAADHYTENVPKGEFVLVLPGISRRESEENDRERWKELSIEEHMEYYIGEGMDKKEAMKSVARDRGVSRRDVYRALLDSVKKV